MTAKRNRADFLTYVGAQLPTNTTESIAPLNERNVQESGANSTVFKEDDNYQRGAATTTGTGSAYNVTVTDYPDALITGSVFVVRIHTDNTSTTPTLNVNGAGTKTIKKGDGTALTTGDLIQNNYYSFVYDGTDFLTAFGIDAGSGSGISIGSDEQIPYVNAAGTDMLYDSDFYFDDDSGDGVLNVSSVKLGVNADTDRLSITSSNSGGVLTHDAAVALFSSSDGINGPLLSQELSGSDGSLIWYDDFNGLGTPSKALEYVGASNQWNLYTDGTKAFDINSSQLASFYDDLYLRETGTTTTTIRIAEGRTGDGISQLHLVGDATYPIYGFQMRRSGGANGNSLIYHRGTGDLRVRTLEAANIVFQTNGNNDALTIDSNQNIIPNLPTSSAGLPTGTLWNDSGTVKVA